MLVRGNHIPDKLRGEAPLLQDLHILVRGNHIPDRISGRSSPPTKPAYACKRESYARQDLGEKLPSYRTCIYL